MTALDATGTEALTLVAVLRVLDAIGADVDVKHVLHRVVEGAVAATTADRAAVLVVRGDVLEPAAVAARRPNAELFRRFRAMPSIPLVDGRVDRRQLLFGGRTVIVEDCNDGSGIVPQPWIDTFRTTSVAVTPIAVADHPEAVLAIDCTDLHRFPPAEISALEAIAHAARVALEADAHRRSVARSSVVQRQLTMNVAALAEACDVATVASIVESSVTALFPDATVALELLDERVHARPAEPRASFGRTDVLRLAAGSRHFGYLAVEGGRGRGDDLVVLEAIATHASLALDRLHRERELAERAERAEALRRLSDVLRAAASPATLLARINTDVAAPAGLSCTALAMRHRHHAAAFRGRPLAPDEASLLARSADDAHPVVHATSRTTVQVTVPIAGRAAGVLVVTTTVENTPISAADRELLRAIAVGIGQVAHAARLDRELTTSTRRLATAAVRDRIVDDLDRRVGRTLRQLNAAMTDAVARHGLSDGARDRWRALLDLARQSLVEAHTMRGSLAALAVRDGGFEAALRDVARTFEDETGIAVIVRSEVRDAAATADVEEAIVALVFDALSLVVRPGRCDLASVTITDHDGVIVEIRDDGVGLEQRATADAPLGAHYAVGALRRRVSEIEGRLDVRTIAPRGLAIKAVLPQRASKKPQASPQPGIVVHLPTAGERPVS